MPATELRVAVLGGTGFVGRSVREELEEAGFAVGVFSRTTGCDLTNLPNFWNRIDTFRPSYIVNCAALVGSVNYVSDFAADVVDVNLRMILNVYKVAQQMREAIVINPVANCAYPGIMDVYEESSLWDGPVHPSVLSYGSTRRMMTVLSQCYFDQYGVRSINLAVPNMYGPHDSTNPNKTHALNALVIKFIRAQKYEHPEVEVWGTGRPIREWLYVKDFASVVRSVIASGTMPTSLLNVAQNTGYSVIEIVEKIRNLIGYDGTLNFNSRYQDGSPRKVMGDRYFRQLFPYFRFTSLEDGLQETIQYYQELL